MREIIDIKIGTRNTKAVSCKTDLLCVGHFADVKQLDKTNKQLNKNLAEAVGADGYITKPFTSQDLLDTIGQFLKSPQ